MSADLPRGVMAVRIPVATCSWVCFLFFSLPVFIFLPRNHLPKGSVCLSFSCVLKKTSETFNHSFISISLAQYHVLLYGYNGTRALVGCWAGIIFFYYMASSASGQDEPNRALWLATRTGKMEPPCPLGTTRCIPQAKFHQKPYNKSFIDQVCSVKMAGY